MNNSVKIHNLPTQPGPLGRRMIVISGLLLFLGILINYPVDIYKLLLAFLGGVIALKFPLKWLGKNYVLLMFSAMAVIAFVILANELDFSGVSENLRGSNRWVGLPLFSGSSLLIQPTEWVKLAFVVYLAGYFAKRTYSTTDLASLVPLVVVLFLLSVLALLTPDLSMIALYTLSVCLLLLLAGLKLYWWLGLGLAVAFGVFLFAAPWFAFSELLGPGFSYIDDRIQSFTDPWAYPTDQGYQVLRSLLAIHRGGLLGQGLGMGERFIPLGEQDFVFSLVTEELGIVTAILVVLGFMVLLHDSLKLALKYAKYDPFRCFLASACGIMLFLQALIHVLVSINLFPNTGLTLPFVSLGFNSLAVSIILVVWLIRLDMDWLSTVRSQKALNCNHSQRVWA